MNPDTILALIKTHGYLPLAILIIGYLARLTSDMSKFPINIPPRAQPLVVLVLGQAHAVLLLIGSGITWQDAVLTGFVTSLLTMGLYDVVVKAIFDGTEPRWIARLALIFPTKGKPANDTDPELAKVEDTPIPDDEETAKLNRGGRA